MHLYQVLTLACRVQTTWLSPALVLDLVTVRPPPSPPRREARNQLKPPAALRIPAVRGQLGHPGAVAVCDLNPDKPVARPHRDRDRLARGT